jgi:hypothetical protein
VRHQLRENAGGLAPERAVAILAAFAMQAHAGWPADLQIRGAHGERFTDARTGIVEEQQ